MYNGQTFTHFTEKEGLSGNYVYTILEDRQGILWFSTHGGGIKFDGEMMNKEIKVKKKKVILSFKMKAPGDQYSCFLTITPSGSATLSISSNNKSSISYNGAVTAIEEE